MLILHSQPILGQRDLRSYVMSVLSVDEQNYENPEDYVERNKYFFTSDLPAAELEETHIPARELRSAILEMMASDSLGAVSITCPSATSSYASLKTSLNESAAAYSAAIEELCHKRVLGDDDVSKALLKEWRKAIHRYLREKLAFGMPGPSSSQTMAVLGYDECCRRVGVA